MTFSENVDCFILDNKCVSIFIIYECETTHDQKSEYDS